jgi:hypothetical protein
MTDSDFGQRIDTAAVLETEDEAPGALLHTSFRFAGRFQQCGQGNQPGQPASACE